MFEDSNMCLFCNASGKDVQLYKVYQWDKPDRYSWYCKDHYRQVEKHHDEQARAFVKGFESEQARAYLSPKQLELWEKMKKKYDY
ncbi:hypothetical protein V7128_07185 [Neobacillus vireti]|uniref:hypothetical protein n=1 Tax=Neobacillus vireti TaxID=220686 RepID=UPI002FFF04A3